MTFSTLEAALLQSAERCQDVHSAIKAGRTRLEALGEQDMGDGQTMPLVRCPHCGTTLVVVGDGK
jgi:hypothetical protein